MGIHFTRSPKIKRAPTKTAVSALIAATESGKDTYYGYIVDIWELDYGHDFKVPLFKCTWVNLSGGGVQVDPQWI